ncbi:hypothetical protein ABH307_00630 [Acinetobacter pittii]
MDKYVDKRNPIGKLLHLSWCGTTLILVWNYTYFGVELHSSW